MKKTSLILVSITLLILSMTIISSARLPTVDGDSDTWGTVLNDYLNVSLNASGELRPTNLSVTQKITFALGGIIDNIINGWVQVTGGLNVRGAGNFSGTIYINNATDISTWQTNISKNYTQRVFDNWNSTWDNRWINTLANLQSVMNASGVYETYNTTYALYNQTFNQTYHNYALNVSKNYTQRVFDNWNLTWDESGWVTANFLSIANSGWNRSGTDVFLGYTGDKVGIGTTNPTHTLNVVGDLNVTGTITGTISSDAFYRTYDTGWVSNNDWSNQHLGTAPAGNVVHNLNAPLSNLTVRVLISTDGTDDNSFEVLYAPYDNVASADRSYGIQVNQVDTNNLIVQTGANGLFAIDTDGTRRFMISDADYYKVIVTQIIRVNTTPLFGGTPANAIMAFNLSSCPSGWILADGSSGTPDLRGIFIRGAGTSGSYQMANGTYYTAPFGTGMLDMLQGHWHSAMIDSNTGTFDGAFGGTQRGLGNQLLLGDGVRDPVDAGAAYGEPRTGGETAPVSFALIYCMKTTEDSVTSNTIWAESGGEIIFNNASQTLGNINLTGNISNANSVILDSRDPIANAIRVTGEYMFTAGNHLDYSASFPNGGTDGLVTFSELPSNTVAVLMAIYMRESTVTVWVHWESSNGDGSDYHILGSWSDGGNNNLAGIYWMPTSGNTLYRKDVSADTISTFKIIGYKVGE